MLSTLVLAALAMAALSSSSRKAAAPHVVPGSGPLSRVLHKPVVAPSPSAKMPSAAAVVDAMRAAKLAAAVVRRQNAARPLSRPAARPRAPSSLPARRAQTPSAKPRVAPAAAPMAVHAAPTQTPVHGAVRPPEGYDKIKASNAAPDVARHLALKGRDGYSRKVLKSWQLRAGIAPDGIYGHGAHAALAHFVGKKAPRAFFNQGVEAYPWGEL